jgi:hypothetical protein
LPGTGEGWVLAGGRLNGGRWILDLDARQVSRPPLAQRFHADAAAGADDGRWLAMKNEIIDLSARRRLIEVSDKWNGFGSDAPMQAPVRMPHGGYAWPGSSWAGPGVGIGYVPPLTLDVPADVLQLWVQVILRCELGPDEVIRRWDESTWERKQQELIARAPPTPDFPFPGRIATDRLHWLRAEVEALSARDDQGRVVNGDRLLPVLDRLIAAEPTASLHALRSEQLEVAKRWRAAADDYLIAYRLNPAGIQPPGDRSWERASPAGHPLEYYQAAVLPAEFVRKEMPHDWDVTKTLGVAYYRAGRFREALTTLQEAVVLHRRDAIVRQWIGPNLMSPLAAGCADPVVRISIANTAFLAMTHARLGDMGPARARLKELRTLLADPDAVKDGAFPIHRGWLQEAVELIEGKPPAK